MPTTWRFVPVRYSSQPTPSFGSKARSWASLLIVCCTDVTFAPLSDQQIDYYISTYRPFDKAGAYGIQEWIGYVGCTRLEGSYFNVMGLPVQKLYQHLQLLKV